MTILRSWSASLVGLALVAVLAPASAAVAGWGAAPTAEPAAAAAPAARVRACTVPDINVHRGRLGAAAGSRYQRVLAVNESGHACSLPGWTRYRFVHRGHAIGFRSPRNPGFDASKPPIVIPAGGSARSVLSWVDPGPVPPGQCHARRATGARVRLAGLPGRYLIHPHALVCTTRKYRPHGTRLHVR